MHSTNDRLQVWVRWLRCWQWLCWDRITVNQSNAGWYQWQLIGCLFTLAAMNAVLIFTFLCSTLVFTTNITRTHTHNQRRWSTKKSLDKNCYRIHPFSPHLTHNRLSEEKKRNHRNPIKIVCVESDAARWAALFQMGARLSVFAPSLINLSFLFCICCLRIWYVCGTSNKPNQQKWFGQKVFYEATGTQLDSFIDRSGGPNDYLCRCHQIRKKRNPPKISGETAGRHTGRICVCVCVFDVPPQRRTQIILDYWWSDVSYEFAAKRFACKNSLMGEILDTLWVETARVRCLQREYFASLVGQPFTMKLNHPSVNQMLLSSDETILVALSGVLSSLLGVLVSIETEFRWRWCLFGGCSSEAERALSHTWRNLALWSWTWMDEWERE